jgi:hypothetical protein
MCTVLDVESPLRRSSRGLETKIWQSLAWIGYANRYNALFSASKGILSKLVYQQPDVPVPDIMVLYRYAFGTLNPETSFRVLLQRTLIDDTSAPNYGHYGRSDQHPQDGFATVTPSRFWIWIVEYTPKILWEPTIYLFPAFFSRIGVYWVWSKGQANNQVEYCCKDSRNSDTLLEFFARIIWI